MSYSNPPLIDVPPYHRPATPEEIRAHIFEDDATDAEIEKWSVLSEGWVLSFFSVATKSWRQAAWGWVKGYFGVSYETIAYEDGTDFGELAKLSHLPSDRLIATFLELEEAAMAAEMIEDSANWSLSHDALQSAKLKIFDLLKQKFCLRFIGPRGLRIFSRTAARGN